VEVLVTLAQRIGREVERTGRRGRREAKLMRRSVKVVAGVRNHLDLLLITGTSASCQ
jgi:hypothetical protein